MREYAEYDLYDGIKMTLYRYTYDGEGIYQAFKRKVDARILGILKDTSRFNWLPSPNIYENTDLRLEAWFTEVGNEKFRELVLPIFEAVGLNPQIERVDGLPGTPVYADEYQVIIDLGKRHRLRNRN